jgi:succinate dehydrogenase assembly factor 1
MHSNFQKEILLFYRSMLKWANKKPEPAKTSILTYVKSEYRKNQNIPKKKFDRVR